MNEGHIEHSPDESVHAKDRSPVAIAKIVDTLGRGASSIILAAAFAAAFLAAWAAGRSQTLAERMTDREAAQQRAVMQMHAEYQHALDEMQRAFIGQHAEYEHELNHYVEKFTALDRQYRMTELKLDDTSVVLHRAGLQLPGDYTRGPQGNLDAESFHITARKEK